MPASDVDAIKARLNALSDADLLTERDRFASADPPDDKQIDLIDDILARRTWWTTGDTTVEYVERGVELEWLRERVAELEDHLQRVLDEFNGTHDYIDDLLNGDVTGSDDPADIIPRLKSDMRIARSMDEKVMERARRALAGDAPEGEDDE